MTNEIEEPGFAPADPTDDRKRGDWESHYSKEASYEIRIESIYLAFHLFGVLITVFIFSLPFVQASLSSVTSTAEQGPIVQDAFGWRQLLHSWLGGVLGGTLYAIKWHYHVVAKQLWHLDRRLWRLFTPHLSGALAFSFVILMGSGLIVIVDQSKTSSVWVCFGVSFLVGYFSDSATAKLSEVAATLFGTTKRADVPKDTTSKQDEKGKPATKQG